MWQPRMNKLPGDRLHLNHGPIDVVLKAWGTPENVRAATRAVARTFPRVLPTLMEEVKELKKPMARKPKVQGSIARRMVAACEPFSDVFVTPMAAVAGAVAEALLDVMIGAAPLDRAYVNDGGDIAVHLTPGETLTLGVAGDFSGGKVPRLNGSIVLTPEMGQFGIATSGAQGRSFSLGIADSVTVVARTASLADVAATLIANAVDVDSKKVEREPANQLDPDSDLGKLLVTTDVGRLSPAEREAALAAGALCAETYLARGLIAGAVMMLQGDCRVVGAPVAQITGAAA
jgi:hypothetical protein